MNDEQDTAPKKKFLKKIMEDVIKFFCSLLSAFLILWEQEQPTDEDEDEECCFCVCFRRDSHELIGLGRGIQNRLSGPFWC